VLGEREKHLRESDLKLSFWACTIEGGTCRLHDRGTCYLWEVYIALRCYTDAGKSLFNSCERKGSYMRDRKRTWYGLWIENTKHGNITSPKLVAKSVVVKHQHAQGNPGSSLSGPSSRRFMVLIHVQI
jgi:hypothetical protein